MTEKKKIPCRVCGTLFDPCATCQSDNKTFRWRNFACSLKCAEKYINDTIAYRESQKQKAATITNTEANSDIIEEENIETPKRKYNKKISVKETEDKIEINETE